MANHMEGPGKELSLSSGCYFTNLRYSELGSVKVSPQLNLIVGPNNSGKTQLLRDILTVSFGRDDAENFNDTKILFDYEAVYADSESATIGWYESNAKRIENTNYYDHEAQTTIFTRSFDLYNFSIYEQTILDAFSNKKLYRGAQKLSKMLTAKERLALTSPVKASSSDGYPETQMEQFALMPGAIERLSNFTQDVFEQEVDIWTTGGGYQLVLGRIPISRDNWPEYQNAAARLPLVDDQGDGVRSFVGILVSLLSSAVPILLIDEPEAFLHPPQARKLGGIIAELSKHRQIFIATHSAEILEGILDSYRDGEVAIHRITRDNNVAHVDTIPAASVVAMSSDPLVRHANLIDGLFADATVICEADRDAAYYEAVWNHLLETTEPKLDVHFTHALGGKSRIQKAVSTLSGSGLPVVSVLDLDLLSDPVLVQRLIDAHEGRVSSTFWRDYHLVKSAIEGLGAPPRRDVIHDALQSIEKSDEPFLSQAEINQLRELTKSRWGWLTTKKSGISVLEGDSLNAAESIELELSNIGIFIVTAGELESFHPHVPRNDKGRWIVEVLADEKYRTETASQELLRKIHEYLRGNRVVVMDESDS